MILFVCCQSPSWRGPAIRQFYEMSAICVPDVTAAIAYKCDLSSDVYEEYTTCKDQVPLIRITKTLDGQHALLHLIRQPVPLPRPVAGCGQGLHDRAATNDREMHQRSHKEKFHSTRKLPVVHFPNGSHRRTSRRVPCSCKACNAPAFPAKTAGMLAASDWSRHDPCNRVW